MTFTDEAYVALVTARWQALQTEIRDTLVRIGDLGRQVRVVAVTKYIDVDAVTSLAKAGITDVGENRWQVAKPKVESLPQLHWHFIGPLQRNKVRFVARYFSCIHSVDRPELADDLSTQAKAYGKTLDILLQINVSEEGQKSGVAPRDAYTLLSACRELPGIRVRGLMGIARHSGEQEVPRAEFRRLRTLRDELAGRSGMDLPELSMGMSEDYLTAIEEGATIVRIGRKLVLQESLAQ